MARSRHRSLLRTGPILVLLLATILLPTLLSISVGIVALALWRAAFDIVFGVLVLVFASLALTGVSVALALLRRSERLAALHTDFIATVSHELRTPLAGIRLLAETVANDRAPKERRAEVLRLLDDQVNRLDELVQRILRWRALDAGLATFHRTPQEVRPLLEEAVRFGTSGAAAAGAQCAVVVEASADLPQVVVDHEAIVDALRNLVDNAVKFAGDRGPIEVHARRDNDMIVIRVRDHGPGIPATERQRVFDRFYRVPSHMSARKGIGLGLAIVRQVVEGHGGRIALESEVGVGSTFIVHLPAALEHEQRSEAVAS